MGPPYDETPWYQAYCKTMLHAKDDDLLVMIDSALGALRERVLQIGPDYKSRINEVQQLHEALYYLTLLLENTIRGGKFLLC